MTEQKPQPPSHRSNRAGAGVAFIGSGTVLVTVGLAVQHSNAIAAAGFAIMGVGVVFLIANRKTGS